MIVDTLSILSLTVLIELTTIKQEHRTYEFGLRAIP